MNCEEANQLLDLYLDRELDPDQSRQLELHLSECPECQLLKQEYLEFQSFFRSNAPVHTAPPQLKIDVSAAIRRERLRSELRFLRQPWIYAAAAVLLILAVITISVPDNTKELSSQAVARHIQSQSASPLVDIASSDEHALQPWFTSKLNFTPPLASLQAAGYTLMGGRTDVIQNRHVATLVYRRGENIVTLFCWPPKDGLLSKGDYSINGYNVCTWGNNTCNYIVVSRLDKHELDAFVDSLRARSESGYF
jgi:anti-sigma factor RsiW